VFSHPIDGICTSNPIQVEYRARNLGPVPTTATRRCKRQCKSARLPKHFVAAGPVDSLAYLVYPGGRDLVPPGGTGIEGTSSSG